MQACTNLTHRQVVKMFNNALHKAHEEGTGTGAKAGMPKKSALADHAEGQSTSVSDVNIGLPGAYDSDDLDSEEGFGNLVTNDPYAPIREAASQHQVEAARLMQSGNYKRARVLLDRAINLLASIPALEEQVQPAPHRRSNPSKTIQRRSAIPPGASAFTTLDSKRPFTAARKKKAPYMGPRKPKKSRKMKIVKGTGEVTAKYVFNPIKPAPRTKPRLQNAKGNKKSKPASSKPAATINATFNETAPPPQPSMAWGGESRSGGTSSTIGIHGGSTPYDGTSSTRTNTQGLNTSNYSNFSGDFGF